MKKKFVGLFSLTVLMSLLFCGCSKTPGNDNKDSQILEVYSLYVNAMEEKGTTPLSYDEWLSSIKGEKGDKGDKGDTGEKGAKGDKGDAGSNGTNGTNGDDGEDGLSAFEIYQKYHASYLGTEEEWINDLVEGKLNSKVTIIFDANGGTSVDSIEVDYRSKVASLPTSTKTDFIFNGWTLNNIKVDTTSYIFIDDVTLVAKWKNEKGSIDSLNLTLKSSSYEVTSLKAIHDVEIIIPEMYEGKSITSIGNNAFALGSDVTYIELPDSITSIGSGAFNSCTSLTKAVISGGLETIESGTFSGCTSLKSVTFNNGVTIIETDTFTGCISMEWIYLPSTITRVDKNALRNSSISKFFYQGAVINTSLFDEFGAIDIYCFIDTRPTNAGKYWHYVDGVPTIWNID